MSNIYDKNFGRRVAGFKKRMPKACERFVEKWFKDNFKLQGWQTSRGKVVKWETRSRRYGHKILKETGSLSDSIRARFTTNSIVVSYGDGTVSRGTANDDYGKYHNEGIGKNIQRKFFGESKALEMALKEFIMSEMKKIVFR